MTEVARKQTGERRARPVVYPTSDGKPMAKSDLHRKLMTYFIDALEAHFADKPPTYVAGNNFLYYHEGYPRSCVSPDTYVIFGVEQRLRDSYKAWEEGGKLPDVVFEFTSRTTKREDVEKKRPLYEQELRVPEYFQFDPTGDYLNPRLQGFRLEEGRYVPLEVVEGRLHSQTLGLDLVQQGDWLRIWDPKSGRWLPTRMEETQLRMQVEERAAHEAQRADAAEAESERLRRELEALRRQLKAE